MKRKLLLAALLVAGALGMRAQTDCTSKVSTSKDSWNGSGTYGSVTTYAGTTTPLVEFYGSSDAGTKLSQTVTELTKGMYEVTVFATSHNAWNNHGATLSADADDVAYIFATANGTTLRQFFKAHRNSGMSGDEPYKVTISDIMVPDGSLTIGLALAQSGKTEWQTIQIYQLTRTGDIPLTSFIAAYNTAMTEAQAFTESSMFESDWTALQTAISNNTLDVEDPGLTEEQLTTATSNLIAANAAANAAVLKKTTYDSAVSTIDGGTNVNLTSIIVNPSFESGDFTGWTNTGSMAIQGNTSFGKTGSKYAEFWQPNGTKGVSQTIGVLPAGVYQLSLRAKARGVTSAKVFANSNEVAVTIADNENEYDVTFEIADKTAVNIGFEGVGTGAGSSWLAFDNFRLKYVGTIDDLEYTKATGKMGTDKSDAQSAAESTFLGEKTLVNYNALLAAIAEAEASVANYATLKTAIDKATAVRDANNFVTAAATTALEGEISTATAAWTNVTYTDAQATAEIAVLGSAVSGWHAIAIGGKAGAFMASAWGKTSDNWWDAPYINTWSVEGDNDGTGFSVPFFEWFVGETENLPLNTTKTATLSDLDNGMYEVELWARVQRRSDADFGNNNEITMSVNGGDAVSIMNGEAIAGYADNQAMRIGHFAARGMVTDGTLTLSIKTGGVGSNVHWLCWRDVKYTKLDEANMTVNSTAKYGTFCAPFAVTIPGGVTAYSVTGVTGNSLDLEEVSTTIPANKPVVLYAESGLSATTFYGKYVDGTPTNGLLTGVYTDTDAEDGWYVLQNNDDKVGFYEVDTKVAHPTVGANRCYLTIGGGGSAKAFFFPGDGEATLIEGLDALTAGEYEAIYTMGGVKVNALQKGTNIVQLKSGNTIKVNVK